MKPFQIGLLVLVGALGGALIMKFTQRPKPAPIPIARAAPAPAPVPVAPAPAAPAPQPARPVADIRQRRQSRRTCRPRRRLLPLFRRGSRTPPRPLLRPNPFPLP